MTSFASTRWDYTDLAATYDNRPDYCGDLVQEVLAALGLGSGHQALEVGAGTGKLTRLLLQAGLDVVAMEPNASMRTIALDNPGLQQARWLAGWGEALPVKERCADLVAYGSSFNVLPAQRALDECARVLCDGGIWLALWNHRDLGDPLQCAVESAIRSHLPNFNYGSRRISPANEVQRHDAFSQVCAIERRFVVEIHPRQWLDAWSSHATLQRQAGNRWALILSELSAIVGRTQKIQVPYFTRIWHAKRNSR